MQKIFIFKKNIQKLPIFNNKQLKILIFKIKYVSKHLHSKIFIYGLLQTIIKYI